MTEKQCEACESPILGEEFRFRGHSICEACAEAARAYDGARASRVARLEHRAARRDALARELTAEASSMAAAIPFGQPILVGHHSEARDRRYRTRIEVKYRKAVATQREAEALAERAKAASRHDDIQSIDPLAIPKLADKIAFAQELQERMKAANRVIRKYKAGEGAVQALMVMGFDEKRARMLCEPDFAGRLGFADYMTKNNNANIRRMQARIEEIRALHKAAAVQADAGGPLGLEIAPGVEVVRNLGEQRLQLIFDGKPEKAIRDYLSANGWRWARSSGAWQRYLNTNSEWALERFTAWMEERGS